VLLLLAAIAAAGALSRRHSEYHQFITARGSISGNGGDASAAVAIGQSYHALQPFDDRRMTV